MTHNNIYYRNEVNKSFEQNCQTVLYITVKFSFTNENITSNIVLDNVVIKVNNIFPCNGEMSALSTIFIEKI